MKSLNQHISERLSVRKALSSSNFEKLADERFKYVEGARIFSNSNTFLYDYYLERVKADGYKKLEDNDTIKVYFVDWIIYYQYKGRLTTYIMTEVKNGETFREVYDRMIEHIKDHNISLLQ